MWSSKPELFVFFTICVLSLLLVESDAMTRQQLKNSGKLVKKTCMAKNDVTEEEIGGIEQGKFLEDRRGMCYVECVFSMMQVMKNNKINDGIIKQIDMMFPPEMRSAVKAAVENCKDTPKKYKDDPCEAGYRTAKCMYDFDAANFVFP